MFAIISVIFFVSVVFVVIYVYFFMDEEKREKHKEFLQQRIYGSINYDNNGIYASDELAKQIIEYGEKITPDETAEIRIKKLLKWENIAQAGSYIFAICWTFVATIMLIAHIYYEGIHFFGLIPLTLVVIGILIIVFKARRKNFLKEKINLLKSDDYTAYALKADQKMWYSTSSGKNARHYFCIRCSDMVFHVDRKEYMDVTDRIIVFIFKSEYGDMIEIISGG